VKDDYWRDGGKSGTRKFMSAEMDSGPQLGICKEEGRVFAGGISGKKKNRKWVKRIKRGGGGRTCKKWGGREGKG